MEPTGNADGLVVHISFQGTVNLDPPASNSSSFVVEELWFTKREGPSRKRTKRSIMIFP